MTRAASHPGLRPILLVTALLAITSTGCLLRETGECEVGANPKEHACRAPLRTRPVDTVDGSVVYPACDAVSFTGTITGELSPDLSSLVRGTCGGGGSENQYVFVAPAAGVYTFYTTSTSFDTIVYVLSEPCGGAELGCDDDGGEGTNSSVTLALDARQSVTVVVDGYSSSDYGSYRLQVAGL